MSSREIRQLGGLVGETKTFIDQAAERLGLSARSYFRTIKVARTIADLSGSKDIELAHLAEALQYRYQNSSHLLTSVA